MAWDICTGTLPSIEVEWEVVVLRVVVVVAVSDEEGRIVEMQVERGLREVLESDDESIE